MANGPLRSRLGACPRRIWKERRAPPWAQGIDGGPLCARVLDLQLGRGDENDGGKPRGRAVVLDPRRVVLAPLWNEEMLEPGFPRWQDGSTIDEEEYRRCGQAGYPFHEWLRKLLPAGSQIWQPQGAAAAESSDTGAGGRGVSGIEKGLCIGGLDGPPRANINTNSLFAQGGKARDPVHGSDVRRRKVRSASEGLDVEGGGEGGGGGGGGFVVMAGEGVIL
jgi:hypothetical protein